MQPNKNHPMVQRLRKRAARNYQQARIIKREHRTAHWMMGSRWYEGLALGYKESANEIGWAISTGQHMAWVRP
jgi:hypothetical protein